MGKLHRLRGGDPAIITMAPSKTPVNNDQMDQGALSNNVGIGVMLLRWKCSVYKVIYQEVVVFMMIFGTISAVYRFVLKEDEQKRFQEAQKFFKFYTDLISLPFLLGFYVTTVAGRWWQQYMAIPWPDRLMLAIQMYIPGTEEKTKILRTVLIRRALLMLTLLLRSISHPVRRQYPTLQDLVQKGMMTRTEKQCYESITPVVNLFWVPATWFVSTVDDAVRSGLLTNHSGNKLIMEEFLEFRANCGALWSYNWVSIPMIYTQVCTLATYTYFSACAVSRQYTGPSTDFQVIDVIFPVWTILEIIFYVGLLKVAEQIKNPFGDDDEDFDLNFLIDRHFKTVHLGLDYLNELCPPLKDDLAASRNVHDELRSGSQTSADQDKLPGTPSRHILKN